MSKKYVFFLPYSLPPYISYPEQFIAVIIVNIFIIWMEIY